MIFRQRKRRKKNLKDYILISPRQRTCSIRVITGNKFYLENRDRVLNMIPLREGYICIYLEKYHKYYEGGENDKDLGRLIPVCSSCLKVMTDEGERISIKPSNPVTYRRLVK